MNKTNKTTNRGAQKTRSSREVRVVSPDEERKSTVGKNFVEEVGLEP